MARLKIYTIRGNYVMLRIPFGGTEVVAEFRGGDMNRNKYAELSTSKEIVQKAIEASSLFNRQIRLKYTGPEIGEEKPKPDEKEDAGSMRIEDVTSFALGQKYLRETYGMETSEIRNGELMKSKCEELGVTFPNFKLR